MRKSLLTVLCAIIFSVALSAQTPKYVFLFIGDGMGNNQVYLTSQYNLRTGTGDAVNFAGFPVKAMVATSVANSLDPDSSSAGTALSSGVKINVGCLGWTVDGQPTVNICEIAKRNGWGAGVATSVGVNHATPSAFYAHVPNRNQFVDIADQLIESDLDFAAGADFLIDRKSDVKPADLVAKAREAGINVFCGRDEYKPVKGGRVIYLSEKLGSSALSYAIDRKPGEMTLADFTSAGIDYLYSNYASKGFFFMVEGGKIDYACHSRDAATTVAEINDFAGSVQLALDFAAKHPKETLILVTSDHETGGLTLSAGKYEMFPERIANQKMSKDAATAALRNLCKETDNKPTWWQVKDILRDAFGLWDVIPVSKAQERQLTQFYKEDCLDGEDKQEVNLYSSNSRIVMSALEIADSYAGFIWPIKCHSAAPVLLYAYGAKSSAFATLSDNTEIPATVIKVTRMK